MRSVDCLHVAGLHNLITGVQRGARFVVSGPLCVEITKKQINFVEIRGGGYAKCVDNLMITVTYSLICFAGEIWSKVREGDFALQELQLKSISMARRWKGLPPEVLENAGYLTWD